MILKGNIHLFTLYFIFIAINTVPSNLSFQISGRLPPPFWMHCPLLKILPIFFKYNDTTFLFLLYYFYTILLWLRNSRKMVVLIKYKEMTDNFEENSRNLKKFCILKLRTDELWNVCSYRSIMCPSALWISENLWPQKSCHKNVNHFSKFWVTSTSFSHPKLGNIQ